jgi:WD40 repeat protein
VWDLEAAELLREIPATSSRQLWPALSPDGRTLAVANLPEFGLGADQTISLWDLDTGDERLRFPHAGNARHLAFDPDGRQLAVADMQNAVVRLYDTATGEVTRVIGNPTDARGVNSVAFHPSGEQLAMFLFTPRELRIVALATDEVVASGPLGTASIGARLCYSGDGDALAVATGDDLLNVYDASGHERVALPGRGRSSRWCAPARASGSSSPRTTASSGSGASARTTPARCAPSPPPPRSSASGRLRATHC